jgi:hypothetical protein
MKPEDGLPKVIAVDYYDGANEGFASGVLHEHCYFKLIAWDSDQNQRLYAVVEISRLQYKRVMSLLGGVQVVPSRSLWIPVWEFASQEGEEEINHLLLQCRRRLATEGVLLLAPRIDERPTWKAEVSEKLSPRISAVLARGVPDDLASFGLDPNKLDEGDNWT